MRRRRSASPRTATWCSGTPTENSLAGPQPAAANKSAETPHPNVTAKGDRLRKAQGGDWAYGCQLVDEAFAALPGPRAPPRVFTPMVLTHTGAKLSKSLIREGTVPPPPGARPWMLDATVWDGSVDDYVDAMVWLVGLMLADPQHFYRSYTTQEIDHLMTRHTAAPAQPRARHMNLYRRYFDLVASGRKTIESASSTPSCATSPSAGTSNSPAARTNAWSVSSASPAPPRSRKCSTPKDPPTSTRTPRASSS